MTFTNDRWFRTYLHSRYAMLFIVLSGAIFGYFKEDYSMLMGSLITPLIITIVLFDLILKPAYINISYAGEQYVITVFIPDTRFLILFNKNKIPEMTINSNEGILAILVKESFYGMVKKMTIVIEQKDQPILNLPFFDFSWSTPEDLKTLKEMGIQVRRISNKKF